MISTVTDLDPAEQERLSTSPGLSDEARVRLHGGHEGTVHLLGPAGAYGQLDRADGSLEIVGAAPDVVPALVQRATELQGDDVLVWTRGESDPVGAALTAAGAERERVLWRLHRPDLPLPPARPLPDDADLRSFVVGEDETAWLAVNAAAFADHPEQGRMTLADLQAREAEPWFDPAGFLLAERAGELVGFHWTKVHPGPPAIGEVYVLGIAPSAKGTGLGGALLDAGLQHLRAAGLAETLLYVDEDNPGAVRLYERIGFVRESADVRYRVRHTGAR